MTSDQITAALIVGGMLVLVVGLVLLARRIDRRWGATLQGFASRHGLQYARKDEVDVLATGFELFQREGTWGKRVEHVVRGSWRAERVTAFRYRHRLGRRTQGYMGASVEGPHRFPHTAFVAIPPFLSFFIRPVLMERDEVSAALGGKRFMVIGDEELSRRLGDDERFRTWLLEQDPMWSFELHGGRLFAYRFEPIRSEQLPELLDMPIQLRDHLPKDVLASYEE